MRARWWMNAEPRRVAEEEASSQKSAQRERENNARGARACVARQMKTDPLETRGFLFFFLRIIPGKSGDRARRRRRRMSWGGKEIEGWSDRALESV